MKRALFHEDAEREIIEAAQYYESKAPGLGMSFLLDVENAVGQIRANPTAFQCIADEVRHKLLRRFPYRVLYAIEPERIRILAVGHQHRRPGYWRYRMS